MRRWVFTVLALTVLVGCGQAGPGQGTDLAAKAQSHLECAHPPADRGSGNYDTGPDQVQDDAQAALEDWLAGAGFDVPTTGYTVEQVSSDRVLYALDVAGLTKVAVVVEGDVAGYVGTDDRGWGVASWARCDASELTEQQSEEMGVHVWTDRGGGRVPTTEIVSYDGPEHCDWQAIEFLTVGRAQYLRDRTGKLRDFTRTAYADDVTLPAGSVETGHRRAGRELWTTRQAAYLVSVSDPDDVERWPATREEFGCA